MQSPLESWLTVIETIANQNIDSEGMAWYDAILETQTEEMLVRTWLAEAE